MSDHNFTDSLREFAATAPLRLHMPGHKGKPLPMEEWSALAALDFTELTPTGNLYGGDDWLEEAQRLWAWDWGMDTAFFATGGSTQGIFTLLTLFTRPGDRILVDRVSHKSIHNAMALLDLHPVWLERPWRKESGVTDALTPEVLEAALNAHPEVTAALVTSPTYYGVLTPLEPLAQLCRSRGVKLLCDGAHGAHLPLVLPGEKNCYLGYNPYACCDGVTVSTHKTLPAPGQTAVIFANGVPMEEVKRASALTATTSPSFPMLAALELLRGWMSDCAGEYRLAAERCDALRREFPCLPPEGLDPCRVTLQTEDGAALAAALEAQGIYPEMAEGCHVVCIFTSADSEEDFSRLRAALEALGLRGKAPFCATLPPPPLPEICLSPRNARFAAQRQQLLEQAVGEICAECVAPYPPGVPVVAPGERITKKTVDYLKELCYNQRSVRIVAENGGGVPDFSRR